MDVQPDEDEKEALIARADSAYVSPPTFAQFMQTADVDLGPWERARTELEQARAGATDDVEAGSIRYLLRAAAVETGAIEGLYTTDRGFTFTVAEDILAIEQLAVEKGEDFVRLFDAQLASFEMALDAATNAVPLTESWLRQLHEVTTAGQETYRVVTAHGVQERPLPRGTYKDSPNHVLLKDGGTHSYAPVAEASREVRRVIEQLQTDEFQAADAVHQAAYAHYALVAVHPFSDGNGRVVRALASLFLLRAASVPLFIYSDQTPAYFDALSASDAGDHQPFTRFVRDRAIAVARTATSTVSKTEVDRETAQSIGRAYFSHLGPRHEQMDLAARAITERFKEQLTAAMGKVVLPPRSESKVVGLHADGVRPDAGWRRGANGGGLRPQVTTPPPAVAVVERDVFVEIATFGDPSEAFRMVVPGRAPLLISLDETLPDLTPELDLRLRAAAEWLAGDLVREVAVKVQAVIDERGY